MLAKAHRAGWKIGEVPAHWRERTQGSSRFRVVKWLPAYLHWYFYIFATALPGPQDERSEGVKAKKPEKQHAVASQVGEGHGEAVAAPAIGNYDALLESLSQAARDHPWVAWLLVATPVVISLLYVHSYGVNIAWEDQLRNMTRILEKWYAGTLHISDFWFVINEHRHFFPMITMFLLALASGWNTMAEMYFTQSLLLAMLAIVILALRRSGAKQLAWFSIPVAAMIFSLRQYQNMLTGFQIAFVMTAALCLMSFFFLYLMTDGKGLKWKFACGLFFATLAGFSAAQGLFVWVVGLVQLLVLSQPRRRKAILASLWSFVAIVEWVVYFWDWLKPGWHPPWTFTWEYFLAIAGGALYGGPTILAAQTAGALLLILTMVAIVLALGDWQGGKHVFWLGDHPLRIDDRGANDRRPGRRSGNWQVGRGASPLLALCHLLALCRDWRLRHCVQYHAQRILPAGRGGMGRTGGLDRPGNRALDVGRRAGRRGLVAGKRLSRLLILHQRYSARRSASHRKLGLGDRAVLSRHAGFFQGAPLERFPLAQPCCEAGPFRRMACPSCRIRRESSRISNSTRKPA